MTRQKHHRLSAGFSLIELLTALAIFLVICGVAFGLLTMTMRRYQTDSQVLTAFQEARFGLDQMVRDINDSGYPPVSQFQTLPSDQSLYAVTPVAWGTGQGYPNTPCTIGTCSTPGDFDLILETKTDPVNPNAAVQWIRYQLQGNILYRAVVNKPSSGGDPDTATSGQLVPYVQNVMNNTPTVLPGGAPVPIFQYMCDSPNGPKPCTDPGVSNSPENVRSVSITLIVMTAVSDAQTGQRHLVELRGRGQRINPSS